MEEYNDYKGEDILRSVLLRRFPLMSVASPQCPYWSVEVLQCPYWSVASPQCPSNQQPQTPRRPLPSPYLREHSGLRSHQGPVILTGLRGHQGPVIITAPSTHFGCHRHFAI